MDMTTFIFEPKSDDMKGDQRQDRYHGATRKGIPARDGGARVLSCRVRIGRKGGHHERK